MIRSRPRPITEDQQPSTALLPVVDHSEDSQTVAFCRRFTVLRLIDGSSKELKLQHCEKYGTVPVSVALLPSQGRFNLKLYFSAHAASGKRYGSPGRGDICTTGIVLTSMEEFE